MDDYVEYVDLTTLEEMRLAAIAGSMRRQLLKHSEGYYVIDDNGGVACDTIEQVRQFLEEGYA